MLTRMKLFAGMGLALCVFWPVPNQPAQISKSRSDVPHYPSPVFGLQQPVVYLTQDARKKSANLVTIPDLPRYPVLGRTDPANRVQLSKREPQDHGGPILLPIPQPPPPPIQRVEAGDQPERLIPEPVFAAPPTFDGKLPQGNGNRDSASQLGAEWDRRVHELQLKDGNIKQIEQHLAQLRKERGDLAKELANVASKLAPLVAKAQADANPPPPPNKVQPETKPELLPNPAKEGSKDAATRALESIQKRLDDIEKRSSETKSNPALVPDEDDPKVDAECPLVLKNKGKATTVAVICRPSAKEGIANANWGRALPQSFIQALEKNSKTNDETINFVGMALVEKFLQTNPKWDESTALVVGKHFVADFVIVLELQELTLYEPGSNGTLYRGKCEIPLTVLDVRHPETAPLYQESFECTFPRARGPIDASNGNPKEFQEKFLKAVAKELSWRFTAHLLEDNYKVE